MLGSRTCMNQMNHFNTIAFEWKKSKVYQVVILKILLDVSFIYSTGYKSIDWFTEMLFACMYIYIWNLQAYLKDLTQWHFKSVSLWCLVQNSFVQLNSDIAILYLWWVNEAACVLIVWSTHTVSNQIEIPGCIPVIV